jgi:hypothetical protein
VGPTRPGTLKPLLEKAREALETLRAWSGPLIEQGWKRLPGLATLPAVLQRKGPLLPAALGASFAIVLVVLGWLFSRSEPAAPAAMLAQPVRVESSPSGALLTVDGEECGRSGCTLELEPGPHRAEARLTGYRATLVPFEVHDGEEIDDVIVTLLPFPPIIRVSSDLAQGAVSLDGEPLGELNDGELEVELKGFSTAERTLRVAGRGANASFGFLVEPASLPVLPGPLEAREVNALVVSSFNSQARVYSGARVTGATLDGEPVDPAVLETLQWNDLSEGLHEIELESANKTHKVSFDSGPAPTLDAFVQADRNVGALRINTGVDGAAVFLNGKKYRRRTRRGRLFLYLQPNKYHVRVEKEGFQTPAEQLVEIRKGGQARLDYELKPIPKTATLLVTNGVPETEVVLDGERIGQVASNISPGRRVVELRKDLYQPLRLERDFQAANTVEVSGLLESAVGTLRIEVSPADAPVKLALRREGGGTERAISDSALQLEAGTYTVIGTASGYQDYGATVHVLAGESKTSRILLEPDRSRARDPQPSFRLNDWEKEGSWLRQGDLLERTGGGFVLAPLEPSPGVYEFTAFLRRGRRLEWVIPFTDKRNYALFQLGKNFFHRSDVSNGEKSKPLKIRHSLPWNVYIRVRIEVEDDAIVHRLFQNGEWTVIDSWTHSGSQFSAGRFGFHVPRQDRMALKSFAFTPR